MHVYMCMYTKESEVLNCFILSFFKLVLKHMIRESVDSPVSSGSVVSQ